MSLALRKLVEDDLAVAAGVGQVSMLLDRSARDAALAVIGYRSHRTFGKRCQLAVVAKAPWTLSAVGAQLRAKLVHQVKLTIRFLLVALESHLQETLDCLVA